MAKPAIHLKSPSFDGRYSYVGKNAGGFPALTVPSFPKKAAPSPPVVQPSEVTQPRLLNGRGLAQKDEFVPSTVHPEVYTQKPFWDYERQRQVLLSGLIGLFGILYLMASRGFFTLLFGKPKYYDEGPRDS
jgi:hypothetical protein